MKISILLKNISKILPRHKKYILQILDHYVNFQLNNNNCYRNNDIFKKKKKFLSQFSLENYEEYQKNDILNKTSGKHSLLESTYVKTEDQSLRSKFKIQKKKKQDFFNREFLIFEPIIL